MDKNICSKYRFVFTRDVGLLSQGIGLGCFDSVPSFSLGEAPGLFYVPRKNSIFLPMTKKKKVWKSPAMAQAMRSKEDKLRDTLTQIVSGQSRLLNRPDDLYEAIANGLDDIENFKNSKDQLELLAWTLRADFISFKADSDEEKEYWDNLFYDAGTFFVELASQYSDKDFVADLVHDLAMRHVGGEGRSVVFLSVEEFLPKERVQALLVELIDKVTEVDQGNREDILDAICDMADSIKDAANFAKAALLKDPDKSNATLIDIAKLASKSVKFFNENPVIAMVSHSNFGSSQSDGALKVKRATEYMQERYPDLPIDGELQIGFALDRELRDEQYPFTRLHGKDVNTLVFPNLTSARSSYKMLQMLDADVEIIGPIQMGLNKPIHFVDFGATVRDIVNIVAVAAIDAYVDKVKKSIEVNE